MKRQVIFYYLLLTSADPGPACTRSRLEVKKQPMINDRRDMSELTKWSVHVNAPLPEPSPSHLL